VIQIKNIIGSSSNRNFTGRTFELSKIEESFLTNQYVYLIAGSGYGKTTLAREYASRIKEKSNQIVKWIDSMSLVNAFQNLAEELNIQFSGKIETEELFDLVKVKLNTYTKQTNLNVLLVIDNLVYKEDDESLNDFKYLISDFNFNIKILITTKNQNILNDLNNLNILIRNNSIKIQLNLFTKDDCFKFIENKLNKLQKNNFKKEDWLKIFQTMNSTNETENLNILPIMLDKIVSKINQKLTWKYDSVINYLKNEKDKFELLLEENPKAYEILSYMAYLNGNSISLNLIVSLLLDKTENSEKDEDELSEGLKYLAVNSEIMINDDEGTYSIHETTQNEIIKTTIMKEKDNDIMDKIIKVLNNLINIDDNQVKLEPKEEELLNHSIKILKLRWNCLNEHQLEILNKIVNIYRKILLKHKIVLDYYEKILNIRKEKLIANHPDIATSYFNVAEVYHFKADYDKALEYYSKSLEIRLETLPSNHHDIASSYNNIGEVYKNKDKNDKALEYYTKSFEIRKKSLPHNHPDIAISYNNLGTIYDKKGDNDKALEYYTQSLEIQKETLPL